MWRTVHADLLLSPFLNCRTRLGCCLFAAAELRHGEPGASSAQRSRTQAFAAAADHRCFPSMHERLARAYVLCAALCTLKVLRGATPRLMLSPSNGSANAGVALQLDNLRLHLLCGLTILLDCCFADTVCRMPGLLLWLNLHTHKHSKGKGLTGNVCIAGTSQEVQPHTRPTGTEHGSFAGRAWFGCQNLWAAWPRSRLRTQGPLHALKSKWSMRPVRQCSLCFRVTQW